MSLFEVYQVPRSKKQILSFTKMRTVQSRTLKSAIIRMAGVQSIAADLDLGNGLTVENYQAAIGNLEALVNSFNTQSAALGEIRNQILEKEKLLMDFSERMLIGVGAKYGKDSNQYQMAGGTKKSLRKKPKRFAQAVAMS
jgi:hypothetical protein